MFTTCQVPEEVAVVEYFLKRILYIKDLIGRDVGNRRKAWDIVGVGIFSHHMFHLLGCS